MIKINVFALGLYIRIAALLGCCLLVGYIFYYRDWIFTQIVLFSIILIGTIELYRYLSRTNEELKKLLLSLKYSEFNISFSRGNNDKKYTDLIRIMEEIKEEHKAHNAILNRQIFLFEKILKTTELGLIVIKENREIIFQSSKVSNQLGLAKIQTLEDIELALPGIQSKIIESSDQAKFVFKPEEIKTSLIDKGLNVQLHKFNYDSSPYVLVIFAIMKEHESDGNFETWINFSKVISHEILNGISPIVSLTSTLQTRLDEIEGNEKSKESMKKALNIIFERCESLQAYSEKYRTLQRLPEPKKEILKWSDVIKKSIELNQEKLKNSKINISILGDSIEDNFKADSWQMDQVFSNLILNSIQSFNEQNIINRTIEITVSNLGAYFGVKFKDNGIGIHKDIRSNVFIPFFSTRDNGSGIGLSVIKQILWKHNAEIFIQDTKMGASFLIKFPKFI